MIVNNRKDFESKSMIDQVATKMMSTSADLNIMKSMLDILDSENYETARELLERTQQHIEEMQAEAQQQAQAQQQAMIEAEKVKQDREILQDDKKLQNNIDVAYINQQGRADDTRVREENANIRKASDIEVKDRELNAKIDSDNKKSEKS